VLLLTAAERADLARRAEAIGDAVWPEYNRHGEVLSANWERLEREFPEFQFVLYDEAADEVAAQGHTIPLAWDGTVERLPAGIDGAIVAGSRAGATTLCAIAAEVAPARQRGGVSARVLEAMASVARAHGLDGVIAPVRPSWKERYPLVPIERYVEWRRADGSPFDPWLRVHERLGGEVLRPEPRSLRIAASVDEWEEWTGIAFPEDGEYWFPRCLALLEVEGGHGVYYEPNVWIVHR
jgi:GNAT superfamily N-acetyltransferase